MKSITENLTNKIEINKSIFITELVKIYDISNVQTIISDIKNKYKDATHYCYAYIIDDKKKSSDDGEPGGTAGVPIMEVLNKHELNYILCVVIRYFGGIKLGAGGLVRAYSKSVAEALSKADFKELVNGYTIKLETSYDKQKELDYYLKDHYKKDYKESIIYTIECDNNNKEYLEKNYNILSIEDKIIEK